MKLSKQIIDQFVKAAEEYCSYYNDGVFDIDKQEAETGDFCVLQGLQEAAEIIGDKELIERLAVFRPEIIDPGGD